jgi:hypothetical protein
MHLLTPKSSADGKSLEKLTKTVYPSQFTRPTRHIPDGRLNYQNHFFASLSEIISLVEYEWARLENSELFR